MNEADQKLEEARKMLAELAEQNNELQKSKEKTNREIKEHYLAVSKLESDKLAIQNKEFDLRRKLNEAKKVIEQSELLAKQEEENQRVRDEYHRLNVAFNEEMQKFAWFKLGILSHQIDGAKKLAIAKRAILGDKRGLGKTLTSIAWTDLVKAKKILAVVPNDVMGNFEREIRHWAPHLSPIILGGMTKLQRSVMLEQVIQHLEKVLVIINYEAWRKDFKLLEQVIACQFDTVICDEAHMIKEMSTNAYRGVEEIVFAENQCQDCGANNFRASGSYPYAKTCQDCGAVAKKTGDFRSVKNFLPMTGTPILNKPQDIFPLLHLVDNELFSDKSLFLNTYCSMNPWSGKWEFKSGGVERLTTKLSGIYVARDRNTAGIKIPKQEIQYYELTLDPATHPKQFEAYQILTKKSALVVDDLLSEDEFGQKANMPVLHMIALITRQRQMMTWPAGIEFKHPKTGQVLFKCDVEESVKIDKCIDRAGEGLIPELVLAEGERVVLFSQFKKPLIELERRLKASDIRVIRYDGDTPKDQIQDIQMDFDRREINKGRIPKWDVVLCHYKKGGVGLNLNAATQLIILDEEWNPGKVDQAYGRIDRMGQTEETTVHVLRVEKTVDTWMAKLIEEKAEMIAGFETHADLQQQLLDILRGVEPK